MGPPKKFPISAKTIFIMYPRCSLTKEEVLSQIQSINLPSPKKFISVSRENGEPHINLLIQLVSKSRIHTDGTFDLVSRSSSTRFLPTVVGAKSSSEAEKFKAYVEKHGDFIEWGDFEIERRISIVAAAAEKAGTKEGALALIKESHPRKFFLQLRSIESELDKIFGAPHSFFVSNFPPNSFRITNEMQQWLTDNLRIEADPVFQPKSIVIEGPTRIGKTEWARSLGPHNYLAGYLDLGCYSNSARYNVIDNIDPPELKKKYWRELLGAKTDWEAKCKYSKPVRIKGGIPSIVLCNPGEGWSYRDFLEKKRNSSLKEWTLAHVEFVFINSPLF